MTCETCTHRVETTCHRYPPQLIQGHVRVWPTIALGDRCGEHVDIAELAEPEVSHIHPNQIIHHPMLRHGYTFRIIEREQPFPDECMIPVVARAKAEFFSIVGISFFFGVAGYIALRWLLG